MLTMVPYACTGYVFRNVASGPICTPDARKAVEGS